MSWLRSIWLEVFGLFVDDGRFALYLLIWLVACGLALPRIGLPSFAPPVVLGVGLIAILAESALRRSGKRK